MEVLYGEYDTTMMVVRHKCWRGVSVTGFLIKKANNGMQVEEDQLIEDLLKYKS